MNKKLHLLFLSSTLSFGAFAQFQLTSQDWTIPVMEQYAEDLDQVNGLNYSLVDINGDGKADLVDARQNGATTVWMTSSNVPYWKVYLNNGSGFSAVAENWTIPVMEQYAEDLDQVNGANYSLVDINGDGKPDLVDARQNGATTVWMTSSNVPYWKVYLNNGSGFSTVAENWTIPVMEQYAEDLDQVNGANYSLVDIDGDGKPDLVDARQNGATTVWMTSSNVPYWKVYKNTGTAFNLTAENWTIPVMEQYAEDLDQVNGLNYSLVDIDGDGKPDLVDARQNGATTVWMTSSNVPYWKVYKNTGTAFNLTAENWTIPVMEQYAEDLDQVNGANYSLVDMNADGIPDLVDARKNGTSTVWMTSSNVPYWKVYLNSGSEFRTVAEDWTIPVMEQYAEDLDQVNGLNYSLVDINGDKKPDLVDARKNGTSTVWMTSSNVPYWKVYLNTSVSPWLGVEEQEKLKTLNVYPNPSNGLIHVNLSDMENESRIMIYNSIGAIIHNETVNTSDFTFDLTAYETGLYFITVQNSNQSYTAKVIRK